MNNERYVQIIYEAYQNYVNQNDGVLGRDHLWTLKKEEFINKCKTDSEFSEKWGLKIEERELSLEERYKIMQSNTFTATLGKPTMYNNEYYNSKNIPTKLITITYNDKIIESYE